MQKILLYYKFVPIADPAAVRLWQKSLCDSLNLKGRIIISTHGINGTVGGDVNDLKQYTKNTKLYPGFNDLVFKWSSGNREQFPKMSVKVRPEIVSFHALEELKVDDKGVIGTGKHLKPNEVNELIKNNKDAVFFDGRNAYEAEIGRFENAVVPNVRYTRDFISELNDPKYDDIKDKPVITYCTGGIRCEVLSMLMKNRGFKEVYQIDGGIVKYGEAFGDDGLWDGALYVFDGRIKTKFSSKAKDIGNCIHCHKPTSNYENCQIKSCNDLVLICKNCASKEIFCTKHAVLTKSNSVSS